MLDHQHCIGATREHAAGGDHRRMTGNHGLGGHESGREHFVVESQRARRFLHGAERVLRLHREAVDIGAIEPWHVDVRRDVSGEHAAESLRERNEFLAQRSEPQVLAKLCGGLVARNDVQELGLPGDGLRAVRAGFV